MSDLIQVQVIKSESFNGMPFTVYTVDGEPHFRAKEVCEILGFGNPRQALASHVDEEDVQKMDTLTSGGKQSLSYVNESGLYDLVFGSKKPEAKAFKRWVTKEVLPSIRKTGSYSTEQSPKRIADTMSDMESALKSVHSIAMLLTGGDESMAKVEAAHLAKHHYGYDVAHLMKQNIANVQDLTISAQELGVVFSKHLGLEKALSAQAMNKILWAEGMHVKPVGKGQNWRFTDKAMNVYGVYVKQAASNHKGVVDQPKWYENRTMEYLKEHVTMDNLALKKKGAVDMSSTNFIC